VTKSLKHYAIHGEKNNGYKNLTYRAYLDMKTYNWFCCRICKTIFKCNKWYFQFLL